MRRHIAYLKYLISHKAFVFGSGLAIGCSLWRLIWHDISKFYPSEWFAYALVEMKLNKVDEKAASTKRRSKITRMWVHR